MSHDLNETAAMRLITQYIPIKDLLSAAMHGFAQNNTVKGALSRRASSAGWYRGIAAPRHPLRLLERRT